LARVAQKVGPGAAWQGPVSGPVRLSPIQHWFFGLNLQEPHHWNQALLVNLRKEISEDALLKAIKKVLEHHDALRLRFRHGMNGWEQVNLKIEDKEVFSVFDPPELEFWQRSLDLEGGPLVRIVAIKTPERTQLLIIVHHLAIDGVSWRILLEDLEKAY